MSTRPRTEFDHLPWQLAYLWVTVGQASETSKSPTITFYPRFDSQYQNYPPALSYVTNRLNMSINDLSQKLGFNPDGTIKQQGVKSLLTDVRVLVSTKPSEEKRRAIWMGKTKRAINKLTSSASHPRWLRIEAVEPSCLSAKDDSIGIPTVPTSVYPVYQPQAVYQQHWQTQPPPSHASTWPQTADQFAHLQQLQRSQTGDFYGTEYAQQGYAQQGYAQQGGWVEDTQATAGYPQTAAQPSHVASQVPTTALSAQLRELESKHGPMPSDVNMEEILERLRFTGPDGTMYSTMRSVDYTPGGDWLSVSSLHEEDRADHPSAS